MACGTELIFGWSYRSGRKIEKNGQVSRLRLGPLRPRVCHSGHPSADRTRPTTANDYYSARETGLLATLTVSVMKQGSEAKLRNMRLDRQHGPLA
jgi:hypothetical protein